MKNKIKRIQNYLEDISTFLFLKIFVDDHLACGSSFCGSMNNNFNMSAAHFWSWTCTCEWGLSLWIIQVEVGETLSGCILSECLLSLLSCEQKQWRMCQLKTQNLTVEQTLDCYVPLSSQPLFLYGQVLTVVNRCLSIFHTNWGELHLILCFPHELGPPQSLTKNHQIVWIFSFFFF